MSFNIRPASPQDEAEVVALWRACDLVVAYNDPGADFRFALAGPSSTVLVGTDEAINRIAGSVMAGHDGHRGWLYYVASAPDARGAKIGRRMVEAGEDWLRQKSVAKVQLLVRETNTGVIGFYEHLGYETAPRIIMSKWLVDPA
ncbi:GNAT family acetyltransferase [Terrihabitans sp. B22-R8]|uniref:GNAT family acetyltransferase n=1 Tax=Terrihabitans sp. B22-R8 TaxID=3425128 RepID=UPI00403C52CA